MKEAIILYSLVNTNAKTYTCPVQTQIHVCKSSSCFITQSCSKTTFGAETPQALSGIPLLPEAGSQQLETFGDSDLELTAHFSSTRLLGPSHNTGYDLVRHPIYQSASHRGSGPRGIPLAITSSKLPTGKVWHQPHWAVHWTFGFTPLAVTNYCLLSDYGVLSGLAPWPSLLS